MRRIRSSVQFIPPNLKRITPLKNKSDATLPSCGRYKDGLPLLGEIYEMEDTKPRLLIKIIHFGQSWPGEKFAAASIDSFFFFSLLYLTLPLSSLLSIFLSFLHSNGIHQQHREKARASPRLSLISPKSFSVWRLTSPPYIFGLSSGTESHNYHEVRDDCQTAIYFSISPR